MTRLVSVFIFLSFFCSMNTQAQEQKPFERTGFVFGAATGISTIRLSTASLAESQVGFSLPNIKIGRMVSEQTAIILCLPGTLYKYKGSGRQRDRGFEGFIPSVQHWVNQRWWILGGAGLTFDAPAFYDIKREDETTFYFGASVLAATGYEVWQKGSYAIDVQTRVHYGSANVPEGNKTGLAFNLLIGFNWY
jgi:hypothetical protein